MCRLDPAYTLFEKLKVGGGRSGGYRLATDADTDSLRRDGHLAYENTRYANTYIVDRPELDRLIGVGRIPIVHMGQLAGVRVVKRYPATWLSVLLWCTRETTAHRAQSRGTGDLDARLAAWDETADELADSQPDDFTLRIDTNQTTAGQAAATIRAAFSAAARIGSS